MRKFSIIAIALWSFAACSKEEAAPAGTHAEIRIAAEIGKTESQPKAQSPTRASETAFEKGDEIGLRVEYPSEVGHHNARLTHNGKVFTGKRLTWNESAGDAVVSACYPYVEGDDIPANFDVPQNQQTDEAFARADFLAAYKPVVTVEEFAEPVELHFRHVLSKVIVNITDETAGKKVAIDRIVINDFKHSAIIDYANREAALDTAAMRMNVSGHKIENLKHEVILVPQTNELMMIEIITKGDEGNALRYKKYAENVELKSGYRYKLNITLKDGEGEEVIEFAAAAEVEKWEPEDVPETQI